MTEAVQGSSREALPEWQAALSRIQEAANASLEDVADAVHEGGAALEEFAKKAGVSAETVTTALNLGMAAPSGQVLRDFADVAGITAEEFKTLFAEDAAGAFELFHSRSLVALPVESWLCGGRRGGDSCGRCRVPRSVLRRPPSRSRRYFASWYTTGRGTFGLS